MNATVRRILTANSLSRRLYFAARHNYKVRSVARVAAQGFQNPDDFKSALVAEGQNTLLDLHTTDGVTITIRKNYADAMTVADSFLDDGYIRGLSLRPNPVVIDIGGFVGDFSLFAAKRLNACKVIVCEPSPRNWKLLLKNIENNGYEDRIVPVNKAVTDGRDVMMNVDAPDESQCMVSAHYHSDEPLTRVPGVSLTKLLQEHAVENVDLLKIDCEGGEFSILESTPSEVFSRIQNIVFEYHQVDRMWERLNDAKERLRGEGYVLHTRGGLVSARRSQV